MKYNNIDYQRCVLICMVVMIHIVNFSTLYPEVKNFINFFFMQAFLLITGYLVNIRKTYKEFASYIMKILIPFHNYAIKSKCPYFIVVTLLRPTTCQVALAVLHALANRVGNVPQTTDL